MLQTVQLSQAVTGREWGFLPVNLVSEPLLLAKTELLPGRLRNGGGGARSKWGTTTLAVAGGSPDGEGGQVGRGWGGSLPGS